MIHFIVVAASFPGCEGEFLRVRMRSKRGRARIVIRIETRRTGGAFVIFLLHFKNQYLLITIDVCKYRNLVNDAKITMIGKAIPF